MDGEQGTGKGENGGDVEEERIGGRGQLLPEEGEPQITYRSGRHKTALDLLVVRQQQLRRMKDCKAPAGEYVTTQHKPVIFEVRMKKWKEKRTMGQRSGGSARMR